MTAYKVRITETRTKDVIVRAECDYAAIDDVTCQYMEGQIDMNSDETVEDHDFDIVEISDENA